MSERPEVVVVGAGLAGLRTAEILLAAGVETLVVEAQDRVGGRLLTDPDVAGSFVDHGGQWISPDQPELTGLAARLGVGTFDSYEKGAMVDWANGRREVYEGVFPAEHTDATDSLLAAAGALRELATSVPLEQPWAAEEADALDAQTLVGWLGDHCDSDRAASLVARSIEGVFASGPGSTSLLAALFTLNAHNSLAGLDGTPDPGPEQRFDGGAQQLCEGMAAPLMDQIRLGQWVLQIDQVGDRVYLRSSEGDFEAKLAVVTLPPALAGRIRYLPALHAHRDSLTQRAAMGWLIKVHAIYDEPFWRAEGLSGGISSDEGPLRVTADNSPPTASPGVLVGFIEGADARRWATASAQERRDAALGTFARYFGRKAQSAMAYCDYVWGDEPHTRGPYGGYWPPGLWTAYGPALNKPIGRIHWAGTETSHRWNGKMEGALLSAVRVADEVLGVLRPGE